jgi:glycosyltransferase involved in cell wall biosynthesis
MSKLKTVSVVTPVFNSETYVRDAIESVLRQVGVEVEHIIMDGASTDGTMSIVREYEDAISQVVSEPDTGMYNALNKGFARATGQILCYLNGDDSYNPETLSTVVACFADKSIDMCFGDCTYIDSAGNNLYEYQSVDWPYRRICQLGRIPFAQPAAFWSRRLFDRVGGFDETYRYVADTKFFFECLRHTHGRRQYIPKSLAKFRIHPEGFTVRVAQEMRREHSRALRELGIRPGPARLIAESRWKWKNRNAILTRLIR